MRVVAPWGKQRLIGVVTAALDQPPGERALKEIALVLDEEPLLDPALLQLAQWTAAYYQAPIGETLRCALPPSTELRESEWLTLTAQGEQKLRHSTPSLPGTPRNSTEDLLSAAHDGLPMSRARKEFGESLVRRALREGLLKRERRSRLGAAEPTVDHVRLTGVEPQRRQTPQQEAIMALLRRNGGEMRAADLRPQVSPAALQTLRRAGVIEIVQQAAPLRAPEWHPRPRVKELNTSQREALQAVVQALDSESGAAPAPFLLHGVTGSGKTAVYLEAIAACVERGRRALLLLPEIGLTPAAFADFEDAFPGKISILHSGLSAAERAQHWHRARRGESWVVIGTRSAVFAPLSPLGLIIVDEEHDGAYKQQESPRYHGRDLAVVRARLQSAVALLGSATPSLESFENARAGKYRLLSIGQRVERRPLPSVQLVDMRLEFKSQARPHNTKDRSSEPLFSAALVQSLQQRLEKKEQAVILLNRRGYSPVVLCRSCGAGVECRDCSICLSFHKREHELLCHICGYRRDVPVTCPSCGSEHLYFMGTGSEKLEEQLALLFPAARIARLDRDTTGQRGHFARVLAAFRAGELDILVGTQMIAKGHDLPGVTLVGVINADLGLTIPEFRAAERTFQLLTQVAGRAGRGDLPGEVILQVLHPDHYAVQAALRNEAQLFYEQEARFRRLMHYPPFAAMASVQLRHADYDQALRWTSWVGRQLQKEQDTAPGLKVLGPGPALVARVKNEHRFQFLLKSSSRKRLATVLQRLRHNARMDALPATALVIDVDPISLS